VVSQWLMPPYWGWHAFILPQIGQGTIQLDFAKPKLGTLTDLFSSDITQDLSPPPPAIPYVDTTWGMDPSPNEPYLRTTIPFYICPSARNLPNRRPGIGASKNWGYATYRGNMGSYFAGEPRYYPKVPPPIPDPDDQFYSNAPLPDPVIPTVPNGMLYRNSAVKNRDVTDGMSNTLMVGDSFFGYWADGYSCCVRVWGEDGRYRPAKQAFILPQTYWGSFHPKIWNTYWWVLNLFSQNTFSTTPKVTTQFFSFGGQHSGSLSCFALADGSAKAVSQSIDHHLFMALSTRNGALRKYYPQIDIEVSGASW
jgi:hypothetical protein